MPMPMHHESVLLHESIAGLAIQADGIYVDGTFGRGGHAQAILAQLGPRGRLVVIDKDLTAIENAQQLFGHDKRVHIVHNSFAHMDAIAQQLDITGQINGVLLDLGVSSPQLDNPERGFSFLHDGPLDMRMDHTQALDAQQLVNHSSVRELATVFKLYGEERFALRIARAIEAAREAEGPIQTTARLAEIVKHANPKWEKHKHPATRVFQAIRIAVNHELDDLTLGLVHAVHVLAVHGRLVVISFHSLEDRLVKQFMRASALGDELPVGLPIRDADIKKTFKCVGKAIKPSREELDRNNRSRSAVLRIGEKIA
jgi:16S rRNA (cytosine1402-N4)-methyltransferase